MLQRTTERTMTKCWNHLTTSFKYAQISYSSMHNSTWETSYLAKSPEPYIMSLYTVAANCNYGAFEHKMVQDRLVVRIRDIALSKWLQLNEELTLKEARKAIYQREAVQEQQSILSGTDSTSVDTVRQENDRGRQRNWQDSQHCCNRAHNPKGVKNKQGSAPK